MRKYIFIFGNWPEISKKELRSVLTEAGSAIEFEGQNFALAQVNLEASKLMQNLGGTVKIADFLEKINDLSKLDIQKWKGYLNAENKNKKLHFGFSLYNDSRKNHKTIDSLAKELKKELKQNGLKARYVSSRHQDLSSVIVKKNELLNNELLIIKHDKEWILGLTRSVQDFGSYAFFDVKRPNRDERSGMLPPKLAKMMINLAGTDRKKLILDPFCGSGTIVQEAALLGFKNIYGSDLSQKAIDDTKKNSGWLKKQFRLSTNIKLQKIDARKLSLYFKNESIDLIVSEPFMGDARFVYGQKNIYNLENLKSELQNLYIESFKQFRKILKKDGQIVFIFPLFNIDNKKLSTLNQESITKLGFTLKSAELIYKRDNQKVERQISIWQIKN